MNTLSISTSSRLVIALLLAAVMAATRWHHFGSAFSLPDASLAVFFLIGFYLRSPRFFAAFLAEAALVDYLAITIGGVSDFCISPAYVFLIPAYGAMWFAGRRYAARYRFAWATLPPLMASVFVGAAVYELFSSGGFYFFSGRFNEPTLIGFGVRLAKYFPSCLGSAAFYVGIAAVVHAALVLARNAGAARDLKAG